MEFIQQDTHDTSPNYVCILLHGLGADGNDLAPLGEMLAVKEVPMRFIYPHAPTIPLSQNHGLPCSAWYDFDEKFHANLEQLASAVASLDGLVEQQISEGVAAENIAIAGFSQGGSVVLHAAVALPHKFAGVCSISGFLSNADSAASVQTEVNKDTSFLLIHGTEDQVVPHQCSEQAKEALNQIGYENIDLQYHAGGHTVGEDEVVTLARWLRSVFGLTV